MKKFFRLLQNTLLGICGVSFILSGSCCGTDGGQSSGTADSASENAFFDTESPIVIESGKTELQKISAEQLASEFVDKTGLLIRAKETFSGRFNGLFVGDFSLTFGFRKDEPLAYRRFTFTFSSASQSETFSVVYETAGAGKANEHTGAYLTYDGQIRSSRYWNSNEKNWFDTKDTMSFLASPCFSAHRSEQWGNVARNYGTLSLVWEEDVLGVYVTDRHDPDFSAPRLIAAFDGTEHFSADESWGLPKIDFSRGYTVSFKAEDIRNEFEGSEDYELYSISDFAPDAYFSSVSTGDSDKKQNYDLSL